jgi:hypothetical protein
MSAGLILCTRPDRSGPCVHTASCPIITRAPAPGVTRWPRTPVTARQVEHAGWDRCKTCRPPVGEET